MADINEFFTAIQQLRALIPDLERIPNPNRPGSIEETIFTDEHLQALLDMSLGNVWRAAAVALSNIAVSEVLISKVITTEDLNTDGAKAANALTARIDRYFSLADKMDADGADAGFVIVPFYLDPPQLEWR